MSSRLSLIICFCIVNVYSMAQSTIGLNKLLEFQQQQSPSYIADYLTGTGEWVTDYSDFEDAKTNYEWYKANVDEKFEPHEKDHIIYFQMSGYKSVILYVTLSQSNYNNIKSEIEASMTQEQFLDTANLKAYVYSNSNLVIQIAEPIIPQVGNSHLYAFFVYDKQDYAKGFRIN